MLAAAALAAPLALAQPAMAASPQFGSPIAIGDGLSIDPMLDARLRLEHVDAGAKEADATTLRIRSGFELKHAASNLSFLVEAAGTLALDKAYNAYPAAFGPVSQQFRAAYTTIADPETIALNRLQVQYKTKQMALTLGRQRINLDDERWVGNVGWRQNEQTFDALRSESTFGPVTLDSTYAIKVRTIFGADAGPRVAYAGKFGFINAGLKTGPVATKAFFYSLNYDRTPFVIEASSSQTYGLRSTGTLALTKAVKLTLTGSFARQKSAGTAPVRYEADYVAVEGTVAGKALTLKAGYEVLGSDAKVAGGKSLQTPLATLHKFNGWADVFLNTPPKGLTDAYAAVAYKLPGVPAKLGLNAQLIYHEYAAETGRNTYGHEWNAAIGFKTGKIGWMVKYADYTARGFGTSTSKLWLQAEYGF